MKTILEIIKEAAPGSIVHFWGVEGFEVENELWDQVGSVTRERSFEERFPEDWDGACIFIDGDVAESAEMLARMAAAGKIECPHPWADYILLLRKPVVIVASEERMVVGESACYMISRNRSSAGMLQC